MREWIGLIVRFVVSALVLLLVAAILPGIRVSGFRGALIAAAVIAILGYLVEKLLGDKVSPQSRGLVVLLVARLLFTWPNLLFLRILVFPSSGLFSPLLL